MVPIQKDPAHQSSHQVLRPGRRRMLLNRSSPDPRGFDLKSKSVNPKIGVIDRRWGFAKMISLACSSIG